MTEVLGSSYETGIISKLMTGYDVNVRPSEGANSTVVLHVGLALNQIIDLVSLSSLSVCLSVCLSSGCLSGWMEGCQCLSVPISAFGFHCTASWQFPVKLSNMPKE